MAREKLPSRYLRSRGGTYAYVETTRQRDVSGARLYRLKFLPSNRMGGMLHTLAGLEAQRVRWLKNKPTPGQIARAQKRTQ